MATIRQIEKTGKWQAQVRLTGYPNQSKNFSSKIEARKWAKAIEKQLRTSPPVVSVLKAALPPTKVPGTLNDLLERYERTVSINKKSYDREVSKLNTIKIGLGTTPLISLDASKIALWRDQRLTKVASPTVRKELALLSHVIDTAIKEWAIQLPNNPCLNIRKPKPGKARDRRLSPEELNRLLSECRKSTSKQLYPLVILALETACRLGELLSLEWKYVDLEKRVIVLPDTKNGDCRKVPLSTTARDTLEELKTAHKRPKVFYSFASGQSIKTSWNTAKRRAGIEDFRFHDLRHEAVSRLFEKGLNVVETATISGHKSLSMLNRYTHLRVEDLVSKLG